MALAIVFRAAVWAAVTAFLGLQVVSCTERLAMEYLEKQETEAPAPTQKNRARK